MGIPGNHQIYFVTHISRYYHLAFFGLRVLLKFINLLHLLWHVGSGLVVVVTGCGQQLVSNCCSYNKKDINK